MRLTRVLAALLPAALFLAPLGAAELRVAPENYVANKQPGYCAWCSLKVLMLQHGLDDAARRVIEDEERLGSQQRREWHPQFGWVTVNGEAGWADPDKMRRRLDGYVEAGYGFTYKMQTGTHDLDLLRDAVRHDLGAAVTTANGRHMVTLVDLTEEKEHWHHGDGARFDDYTVKYIDSNDVAQGRKVVREVPLYRFDAEWDGTAVVLYPDRRKKEEAKAKPEDATAAARGPLTTLTKPKDQPADLQPGRPLPPDDERPRVPLVIAVPETTPRLKIKP